MLCVDQCGNGTSQKDVDNGRTLAFRIKFKRPSKRSLLTFNGPNSNNASEGSAHNCLFVEVDWKHGKLV
jgi:hypothetical protein